jgi:hypothetical protein
MRDDEAPANPPLGCAMLMVILWGQTIGVYGRHLMTASFATIDARKRRLRARLMDLIEGGVIRRSQELRIFVDRHKHLARLWAPLHRGNPMGSGCFELRRIGKRAPLKIFADFFSGRAID